MLAGKPSEPMGAAPSTPWSCTSARYTTCSSSSSSWSCALLSWCLCRCSTSPAWSSTCSTILRRCWNSLSRTMRRFGSDLPLIHRHLAVEHLWWFQWLLLTMWDLLSRIEVALLRSANLQQIRHNNPNQNSAARTPTSGFSSVLSSVSRWMH